MQGGVFKLDFAKRAQRYLEQQMRDGGAETPRKPLLDSPAPASCPSSWRIWLQSTYRPQTGNFDLSITTTDPEEEEEEDQITTTTVTVEWDEAADDLKEKLRELVHIGDPEDSDDDQFVVSGGPLPGTSLRIRNKKTSGRRILAIVDSTNNLTRAFPQVDPSIHETDE